MISDMWSGIVQELYSPYLEQWRRKGGQGGRLPPNVGKDGPRNSSKFDEKIGMGVGTHLRCEKIINTKYF